MQEPVIVFDHVYKKFSRGEQHTTLRDFIPAVAARIWSRGRTDRSGTLGREQFWALQDVAFTVGRGEALGIIGPNGSGKSTALKLLSGILRPDRGSCHVKGMLSALIEVGAGFHPDLTGRENVFLNGSILGMTRKEIALRFNDIVEFAGVGDFIDTPLKHYSSGMAVRLGFAVSAFVEPDVLLVDEVLAVGDAEFRNRCQNRMEEMRRNGVTMILVSHNLNEVRNLCEKTLMLCQGRVAEEGPTQKVLERYHQMVGETIRAEQDRNRTPRPRGQKPAVELTGIQLLDEQGVPAETFHTGAGMRLRISYHAHRRIERPRFEAELVWAAEDWTASLFGNGIDGVELGALEGRGHVDLEIEQLLLEPNVYLFNVQVADESGVHDRIQRVRFVVAESLPIPGVFGLPHSWSIVRDEAGSMNVSSGMGLTGKVA